MEKLDLKKVSQIVLHCQVKKCHPDGKQAGKHKLMIATNASLMVEVAGKQAGPWIYTVFNNYMKKEGIEPSMGAPPKGQMERTLENLLKLLTNSKDLGTFGTAEDEESDLE